MQGFNFSSGYLSSSQNTPTYITSSTPLSITVTASLPVTITGTLPMTGSVFANISSSVAIPTFPYIFSDNSYAPANSSSTSYEWGALIKSSAGRVYKVVASNESTASLMFQMYNLSTLAPVSNPVVQVYVPGKDSIVLDYHFGRSFDTGFVRCHSASGSSERMPRKNWPRSVSSWGMQTTRKRR